METKPTHPEDVTVAELLDMITRLGRHEPHAHCRVGSGPLAPVAAALNELAVQRLKAQLWEENYFGIQALVAQTPNPMVTCDADTRIRFINHTVSGQLVANLLGKSIYQVMTPATAETSRSVIERVLSTGESGKFETQAASANGSRWYTSLIGPIKDGQRIIGFTMINTDITELKQTQQHLERSNQELESFAYVASHDLQEPLRKIQTFGERLKTTSSAALSPEGRDYIDRMQKAATRMRGLIDDLLSFARLSSTNKPFIPVDLATVAREVTGDLEASIERTGASVTLGDLPVLDADPTQMRQLLQNLMGNALKFRREGVPLTLCVRAAMDPNGHHCELVVEDNGIGFDEKYVDRIFNVFQRLHGRGQYEGSGIGLAICRKIAERHGGRIGARSTPGVGSAFSVTLPLKQPSSR